MEDNLGRGTQNPEELFKISYKKGERERAWGKQNRRERGGEKNIWSEWTNININHEQELKERKSEALGKEGQRTIGS